MLKYLLNMALSLTESLNQLDVNRIVHNFDQAYFKIAEEPSKDQANRVIVMIQFERMLAFSLIPIELINKIMRRCLENSPSVRTLLMYYKNTPPIVMLHPLPLSSNAKYINTASQSLLVRLEQTPADGKLAS